MKFGTWSTICRRSALTAAVTLTGGCYVSEVPEVGSATDTETDGVSTESGDEGTSGAGTQTPTSGPGSDESGPATTADDTGGTDTDGPSGAQAELEELIGALCDWEFNCCSEGELDYRLGPFTVDADDCRARYVEQLYSNDDVAESNRGGLLYSLGFLVRLDRSSANRQAADECRDLIAAQQCTIPFNPEEQSCTPGDDPALNPCDLRNLFEGTLEVGDECSASLAGLGFDVECAPGSSCEEVDGDYICVDKGLEDEFCEADYTCDQGLFCEISSGRCQEKAGLGEACAYDDPDDPALGTEATQCRDGLTCDPQTQTCTEYCSTGYACGGDAQCPAGESCIPVDFEDGTHLYCGPRGDTNGDRCDTDNDCGDGFHCAGDSCVADRAQGIACTLDGQCQDGLYCDIAGSGDCEIVLNTNVVCTDDRQCNPSTTQGCMTSDNGRRCRASLLDDGDDCIPGENEGGNWCASGVCEDITDDATSNPECHVGADAGEACDASAATFDALECRPGTYCLDDVCVVKEEAGADCSDDGNAQCLGGVCDSIWEGEYCTDAVPVDDIETAATCDGVE